MGRKGTPRTWIMVLAIPGQLATAGVAGAQHDHGTTAPTPRMEQVEHSHSHMDSVARLHMLMTSRRAPAAEDSARGEAVLREIRGAISRYADSARAIADGYEPFLPGVPQRVYHYTNRWNALREAFRFDPARPTSLLYVRDSSGRLVLHGVMYTAPRRMSEARLDARIPLSLAPWHRHVNWCLPPRGQAERWRERRNGRPVFGPESPIATEAECRAAGGRFRANLFGWMVHVNAFAADPAEVWEH